MGLNACSCLRNLDELSEETDLNGDAEIEGFNIPNNNPNIFSCTDDSTNLTGAGRMSYLMKVNTYDSGTLKNTAFCTMKTGAAVERIQSVFRGSNFRKKFKKNKYEMLSEETNNNLKKEKNEIDFISNKMKKVEKNFEKELDYENDWKKYINNNENKNLINEEQEIFSQQKLNDIINNNNNLIKTKYEGDFITIDNKQCLFKGQMEKTENNDNNNIILTGKGKLYFKKGPKYEGIFINGKLNGLGRYINEKYICYEGIFHDGILEGKGLKIRLCEDGTKKIYEGDLENYKKEGKGIIKCKNYIYEGDFVNDKKQGKGKIIYKDNGNMYEGEFNNDGINGYGLFTFKNMHTYEGQFTNGIFHGKGIYKWPDGCYFKGEYVNGVREGNGEYKFVNGKIFKGPFTKGKPNGKGILTIKGTDYNCEFENGKLLTDLKSHIKKKKNSTV